MPLAGSLDIRDLLVDAPTVTLDGSELRVADVDILQLYYEIAVPDLEAMVPPALNPTASVLAVLLPPLCVNVPVPDMPTYCHPVDN